MNSKLFTHRVVYVFDPVCYLPFRYFSQISHEIFYVTPLFFSLPTPISKAIIKAQKLRSFLFSVQILYLFLCDYAKTKIREVLTQQKGFTLDTIYSRKDYFMSKQMNYTLPAKSGKLPYRLTNCFGSLSVMTESVKHLPFAQMRIHGALLFPIKKIE